MSTKTIIPATHTKRKSMKRNSSDIKSDGLVMSALLEVFAEWPERVPGGFVFVNERDHIMPSQHASNKWQG
jgi:hypothetical protein